MESGQVFQGGVKNLYDPCINGLDVLVAFFAEVNPIQLFSLCLKELERTWFFVFAEGTRNPISPPLMAAERAEEKSFPCLFLEQTQKGKRTANRTKPFQPRFNIDLILNRCSVRLDRRFCAVLHQEGKDFLIDLKVFSDLFYLFLIESISQKWT
jgi:hypothetical protein